MPTKYTVIIHPCEDESGYWAECAMPGGGCTTQGETLQKTQKNMFESIELYFEDWVDIPNYYLTFEVYNA